MKQVLQNFRTGVLKVDDVPETICKSGGVLVRNVTSLISAGTEKMAIDLAQKSLVGKAKERPDLVRQVISKVQKDGLAATLATVKARLDAPLALGYSCAGVVREVGHGAEAFRVGDRVACAGMNYASHAETIFIPKNLTVKIPDNVSFDEASFVTLGAIALQGVRTAEVKLGDAIGVIGLGLLGQMTVMLLKAAGCRVIGIDLDPNKIKLALEHGADAAVLRTDNVEGAIAQFTGGAGVDAIIITAAADSNDPIELAGLIARDRAIVSMVGAVGMDIPRKVYYEKELQLRLSRSYGPGRYDAQYEEDGIDYPIGYVRWTERRNMQEFLRLLSVGAVKLDKLITHRFDIHDAEAAYDIITGKNKQPYLGVLLTYAEKPTSTSAANIISLKARTATATGVQLGVIGAGNFAKAVLLPRLAKTSGVNLVGIATATGRNAKTIGEQYGFGVCTSDYHALLARNDINTVLIATRHNAHARMAIDALRAGKIVYVEKPLAVSEGQLNQIVEVVEQTQGRVMVGFNRRFSALAAEMKQAIEGAGALAITYRVNAGAIPQESWVQTEEGGGRIVGEVCHFVDFLQFLTGAEPVEVFAYAAATSNGLNDTLSLVIRFSDGSTGNINYLATGDKSFPKERVEVYGGGRVAVLDDFRILEVWRNGKRKVTKKITQDKGFDQEIAAFVEATRKGAAMPIDWQSLVRTTATTLQIEKSLRSGKPEIV